MLKTLILKEVKEMLTKSAILYMVAMSLIFALTGQLINSSRDEAARKPVIAVVNRDSGRYAATLLTRIAEGAEVIYSGSSPDNARDSLLQKGGDALLTIPASFSQDILSGRKADVRILWLMKGTGIVDSMPQESVSRLIAAAEEAISTQMIREQSKLVPEVVLEPVVTSDTTIFKGKTVEGLGPGEISGILRSQTGMIPVAIMMLIILGSTSVISSMGMEKENRTLETLLTLPVKRSYIVISKIVGSAIVGLTMGAIYMTGFYGYLNSVGGPALGLGAIGLSLGTVDYLLIGLSVFAALLSALCLSIILGSFASGYRSAQTLTFPIIGLAMLPMMLTLFQDFDTMSFGMKTMLFLIPFSHPMLAMQALILDDYALVVGGILYSLGVTAILVAIAAWIFTTDRVVLGSLSFRLMGWRPRMLQRRD